MATTPNSDNNHSGVRQRRNPRSSQTDLPWVSPSGKLLIESTPIPSRNSSVDNLYQSSNDLSVDLMQPDFKDGPRKAMSGEAVKKDENRVKKILVRAGSGALLIGVFVGCVFAGHIYVCFLVAFVEFLLFRELVRVRYNAFFHTIQDTIPLFRTTQWLWFAVAIVYTYSDFVFEIITNNQDLHHMQSWAQYYTSISFLLYSGTFVLTIATMQVGHIKFQLNQLSWTMLVIALTVGQLKYIMHNVYNGLYWFALPILLVVTNDIMAYVSGMACGRKFIRYPFISFSPNKTWEGFIGGAFFTLIISWYLSAYLSKFKWMTCPTNKFLLRPSHLDCELDPIFQHAHSYFSPQLFELLPSVLVKTIPGVVEKCSVGDTGVVTGVVTACISGEPSHHHHHFELVVKNVLPAQIHALALAVFASFVAPFGGFLASAIKRAYGIKDFDSIIPGHGGVMDRFDCQLLMALCVWVYYNTFIKTSMMSVAKLVYMFKQLSPQDKAAFIEAIKIGRNHQLEDFLN